MTERDLARVEKALAVRLPDHYRRFLLEHATTVARLKRRSDRLVPFFTTAKELLDANRDLRADPHLQEVHDDTAPWPLKYLIVGTDGGGDYWCVDLNSPREAIWHFDHEAGGRFRRASSSTWAKWLAQLEGPPAAATPAAPEPLETYRCKKASPGEPLTGGAVAVRDAKGRDWLCYRERESTPEELLAHVRGETVMPPWLSDPGVAALTATAAELPRRLAKQR